MTIRVIELYCNSDKSSAKSKYIDIKFLIIKDKVGTTLCLLIALVLFFNTTDHSLKDFDLKSS